MALVSSFHKSALLLICLLPALVSRGQYEVNFSLSGMDNTTLKNRIQQNCSSFFYTINRAYAKKSKPVFDNGVITSGASVSVLSMWETSTFKCTADNVEERILRKPSGGYEVRNIPIFMEEAAEDEKDQEMVLIFDNNGSIDNIYISIESNRYNQLINQGNDVTEFRRRQIILDFVENFRTAYNRKDADYIESVFSEDALIITGKVVKTTQPDASNRYLSTEQVTYQKSTKKEYCDKLRRIFANNSYINIKFDEIEIKQHRKYPTLYGVSLIQGWNTTRYSDVGFLFLVIDFTNEDRPQIHVRTWQPNKVGGQELSDKEKYRLEDFNFGGQ